MRGRSRGPAGSLDRLVEIRNGLVVFGDVVITDAAVVKSKRHIGRRFAPRLDQRRAGADSEVWVVAPASAPVLVARLRRRRTRQQDTGDGSHEHQSTHLQCLPAAARCSPVSATRSTWSRKRTNENCSFGWRKRALRSRPRPRGLCRCFVVCSEARLSKVPDGRASAFSSTPPHPRSDPESCQRLQRATKPRLQHPR